MRPGTLLCTFVFLSAIAAAAPADPVVAVTGGRIRGRIASDGGAAFKGIPFARPPVGDLRWREPQPVEPWTDIREASEFRPACTQLSEGWNAADVPTSTEDCLYLNVATPEWPPKTPRPVMFWIHGGSNLAGSGEAPAFEERALVRHGIVWVTVNYRLGPLGFLAHPELVRESSHHASGNYGLMDQIAALRWVRDNIASFGGDPGNITVAGESAGAWDVSLLMTSPLAKGLFHRAIQESGAAAAFDGCLPPVRAQELGQKMAAQLKAPTENALPFLRAVPAVEIMKAALAAAAGDRTGLGASVDGWVLPESPAKVFAEGRQARIPLITGTNAQEIIAPQSPAKLREEIQKAYGDFAERAQALYVKADPLYGEPGSQWATDVVFRCPSVSQAVWHAAAGNPTYEYEFEQPAPGRPASVHAGELVFLFGTWDKGTPPTPADQKVSEQMQSYWANFTRTGSPNGEGFPAWLEFTVKSQDYLAFTGKGAAAKSEMRRPFCELFMQVQAAHATK
ncbi:MAG: carboxylesterase family protein [Bryobacteraceae bacterium]|jgi:para-nitrobenzyl esterase